MLEGCLDGVDRPGECCTHICGEIWMSQSLINGHPLLGIERLIRHTVSVRTV